jgi:hypothetical protein
MPTSTNFRNQRHTLLSRLAAKRGGALLTREYVGGHLPLMVRCTNGHRFQLTAKNLMRGLWCLRCRPLGRQAEFLGLAQKHARKQGGKCLAEKYETARTPLKWQCGENHRWSASYDNVINKQSWCPVCAQADMSDTKKKWWKQHRAQKGKAKAAKRGRATR